MIGEIKMQATSGPYYKILLLTTFSTVVRIPLHLSFPHECDTTCAIVLSGDHLACF